MGCQNMVGRGISVRLVGRRREAGPGRARRAWPRGGPARRPPPRCSARSCGSQVATPMDDGLPARRARPHGVDQRTASSAQSLRAEQRELLPPDRASTCPGWRQLPPGGRRLLEQPVTGRVPVRLVVLLEVVEVDEGHGQGCVELARALAARASSKSHVRWLGIPVSASERASAGQLERLVLRSRLSSPPSGSPRAATCSREPPATTGQTRCPVVSPSTRSASAGSSQPGGQDHQAAARVDELHLARARARPGSVHRPRPGGARDQHVAGQPQQVVRTEGCSRRSTMVVACRARRPAG